MTKRHSSIKPVQPGEVLREDVYPAPGITKPALARALGISRPTLHGFMMERRSLTPGMAVRLQSVVGSTAETWLALQSARYI